MNDDVRPVIDRPHQVGRRQGVVDDQRHAGSASDGRDRFNVRDAAPRVGYRLNEYRFGMGGDRALETADVVWVGPDHVPAETLERVSNLIDRSPTEFPSGYDLVARHPESLKHTRLRGVA